MNKANIYATILETSALDQFNSAIDLPCVVRGALMPDAHTGYTLPIGAVIGTNGVVFPSWIGFDCGCTDMETEFLSPSGWKKISNYNGEEILEFDIETNSASFKKPVRYVKKKASEFYYLNNGTVNQMVTDDHKVLLCAPRNDSHFSADWMKTLVDRNLELSKGVNRMFRTTFDITDGGIDYSDDEIRLLIAISADGCIRRSGRIEFHLRKQRKITRLLSLLERLGIDFNEYNIKDGSFGGSLLFSKASKSLDVLWSASKRQLAVVIDEVGHWDGCIIPEKDRITFSSTNKGNIDVVQYAFAVNGIRSNYWSGEQKGHRNKCYTLYTTKNSSVGFPKPKDIQTVASEDGFCYCFTTSTGFWVMRRNGKITITGNCGMLAVKTTFSKETIELNAEVIFNMIYERIPVGFEHHKEHIDSNLLELYPLTAKGQEIFDSKGGFRQLGTLGGGIHFIEIGYGQDDAVWVIIHSGSRGVGHGLASHYMALASGTEKAKEGHYGFENGTQEYNDYMQDQEFCLGFALASRKHMADAVVNIINEFESGEVVETINRNHNHAEEAHGMVIHRKGATHAEEGMMGVIPGNMRDGSFIVRGKGCEEALWSSSHGAGRIMSRSKARKQIDPQAFDQSMKGVVCRTDNKVIDESPFCYKNIWNVMDNQKDMVGIIDHVKPMINCKG